MLKRITMLFLVIFAMFMTACVSNDNETVMDTNETNDISKDTPIGESKIENEIAPTIEIQSEIVFDITKYANITSEQLVSMLGEPDNIIQTTERGFTEFPCTLYDYENHELGFLRFDLINDRVTAISINGELPYNNGAVLETLNVEASNLDHFSEGDLYKKWDYPLENIDLIHITIINIENDTYKSLKVEFDSRYYREWPIPLNTTEPGEYRVLTEDYVKNLLISPKSANFPWFDWVYKKNDYYFSVESYVDAENAFGAEVRNYFTFIYFVGTSEIAYAIIDDEVIVDNNYIETATIIKNMVENTVSKEPLDNTNDVESSNTTTQQSPNNYSDKNSEDDLWNALASFCNNYNSKKGTFSETLSWMIISPTEVNLYLSTEQVLNEAQFAEFDALGTHILNDICSFIDSNYTFSEDITFSLTLEYYEEEYYTEDSSDYESDYYSDYEYSDDYFSDWESADEYWEDSNDYVDDWELDYDYPESWAFFP